MAIKPTLALRDLLNDLASVREKLEADGDKAIIDSARFWLKDMYAPMHPLVGWHRNQRYWMYQCSNCGREGLHYGTDRCCPNCGRRIDWSVWLNEKEALKWQEAHGGEPWTREQDS